MAKARLRRLEMVPVNVPVGVLAIDSNFESVTLAAFNYRQAHVYPYLEQKGLAILRCQGPMAVRAYVAPDARKPGIVYLTGVGHGFYASYTGAYYDSIFSVGNYSQQESQNKIAHFLSCETARDLGPDFVVHGCRAYFGYDENFTFIMADSGIFFECDSEIDLAFADGLTAADVYTRVINLYDKRIEDLRAAGKLYSASTLEYDRDHLRSPHDGARWGNPQAKLE